jgi:two-component system sensor histidine kinase/response regulator
VKWVRERAELEFDAAGNLRGGFGTTQDISDLKQSEMALRESEARLRQAAQAAHFGIFDGDPIAGTIYWSPELREILGFPADIAAPPLGEIPDLVHPDDAVRMRETCARVLDPAGDGQLDDAFRIRRATGELRWVHLNGRAEFAGEGQERRAVRLSGVMRDVTESHQTQLALQQAKQAADLAAQTKSAFLANMSHEIRTPLSVVIGLAHLLRRDISAPAKVHKLDQLCATSNHLLALLNDILDLSRVHAGRLVLDETDFGLDSVIAQVMRMVESMASAKGLTLTAESTPAVRDLRLRGDPLRLAQVLVNLSGNAVKFTDRGGVRLCVSCIAEQPAAVTLRFAVVDTGCGIAPADQAQLFEPFTQTDSSSTREHGGTGLGLAISQNLVALMGSSIQVRSAPGSGSTFSFEIVVPRATGSVHDAAGAPAAVLTTALDGLHVLFAEDHPQTQMIVLEMLEDLGCEVDLASDGAEAVACARAHAYDLVLLDMQMPKMDGVAAARAIRALPGFAATPIVALTANAFAEDRQRCLDAGMNAHLAKPVTPDTLAAALSPWLPAIAIPSNDTPPCDHPLDLLLAAIPGLHVGRAWRTSPDKLLDYCAQLHRFVSVHADDIGQLRQHLDAGRRSEALLIAHNLAGIASLIGARELASLASDLVRALREDGDASTIQHLAAAGAAAFASLAERISALPGRPEDLASG